jgi:hypothetical protein
VVHLRSITARSRASIRRNGTGNRGAIAADDDVLAYSCLAILRSFAHQMHGLRSYAFFKPIVGCGKLSRMAALGVWDTLDSASRFLFAHPAAGGAPEEECYWRSLGARFEARIYHVVSISAHRS